MPFSLLDLGTNNTCDSLNFNHLMRSELMWSLSSNSESPKISVEG